MPWTRKLYEPIALKDGRKLVTLDDARVFMLRLSEDNRSGVKDAWAQLRRALIGEGML